MLKELDRLQILVSAVFIRHPLAVLLSIIQIQHGRHRVYAKSVHMEMLNPEERIRDKEILHFRLAVVENLRTPVRVFTLSRICVLKRSRPVKISQSVRVPREMRGYPVKDNADIIFMQMVDKISKIFRTSVP